MARGFPKKIELNPEDIVRAGPHIADWRIPQKMSLKFLNNLSERYLNQLTKKALHGIAREILEKKLQSSLWEKTWKIPDVVVAITPAILQK